jgi:hypothetical protein
MGIEMDKFGFEVATVGRGGRARVSVSILSFKESSVGYTLLGMVERPFNDVHWQRR